MTTHTDELGMVMIETEDTPAPVTVPEGDDPIAVLRTMQAFMAGTDRGLCEIIDPIADVKRYSQHSIGLAALSGHPERTSVPVYDCRTRVVEVALLADWLKARGYEASACQWERPNGGQWDVPVGVDDARWKRWRLITGKAQLPPMPSAAPDAAVIRQAARQLGKSLDVLNQMYPMPPKGR